MNEARKIMQDKYTPYQNCPNNSNQDRYQDANINLQNTYSEVIEKYYTEKVTKIKNAHSNNKHGLYWKLINEGSGCQSACQGQLEGDTQADRVRNWYIHFKGLLGNSSSFNNETEDIEPVFTDLNIKTGPFTSEEYTKAKKSIKEGKVGEKVKKDLKFSNGAKLMISS